MVAERLDDFIRCEEADGGMASCGAGWSMQLVVEGEFVERPLPAVAVVFDKALEHGDGGGGHRHLSIVERMSPRNGAMRGKCAVSVRKRPISVSGFSPGWRRRKSLRMSLES